ncbi:MAG: helix-turn-helix transcriptional regulator [Candidatus Auribacterota bacterium]|nr:helix-turn-helix transcriptional regulator [Candidatus Auribacterota bacterium]
MITNDRQYKISRTQLKKLDNAVEAFDMEESENRIKSPILAKAEVDALMSEVGNLESQVREYENLKSGLVTEFRADSMEELPTVLIKARIANGMSQRNLAEAIGIKEQQIQRYESDNYASASLHRLTEVADALSLNISAQGHLDYR